MADYRCPKHDRVFETLTDQRKPGALASGTHPAHPVDGHPDCPKCAEEAEAGYNPKHTSTSSGGFRTIARG